MAGIHEYNDNRYIKEKDEIEKYLMRIIHRYFEIYKYNTAESTEAIIVESITRIKRYFSEEKGFIFHLNGKTGNVVLSIRDLNGEKAFTKNSAFNKDFGNIDDTICEGNDPRLSDAREPLPHHHVIANISGLRETLDSIIPSIPSGEHLHRNQTALNVIEYAGTMVSVDLIIIEELQKSIDEYTASLTYSKKELKTHYDNNMDSFNNTIILLNQYLANVYTISSTASDWLNAAKLYTDNELNKFLTSIESNFNKYVTASNISSLNSYIDKHYYLAEEGDIPISDGTMEFTPVEEEYHMSALSNSGDTLKKIYDSGLRIGVDNWVWDNTKNSFVFQSNTDWAMFASLQKFDVYTHRVTLKSSHCDDDVISVVIAYDEDTGKWLAVHTSCGGIFSSANSVARINQGTGTINPDSGSCNTVLSKNIGPANVSSWTDSPTEGWKGISNGITILVKRDENRIRIWINFNTPNAWTETTVDGETGIYPAEAPAFDFDLTSYSFLSDFVGKKCNYGYGCYSQQFSSYSDVYFKGVIDIDEKYGHTNLNYTSKFNFTMPSSTIIDSMLKGKIKLFFCYDKYDSIEDSVTTVMSPLPYNFVDVNGKSVFIQCGIEETGKIHIETNIMNKIPYYITSDNFFDSKTVYIANCIEPRSYSEIKNDVIKNGCTLSLIDSEIKNVFINSLLSSGKEYFIQGVISSYESSDHPGILCNDNEEPIIYSNWDTGEPSVTDSIHHLKINTNAKWQVTSSSDLCGFVAEYKIKSLSDYFTNPRIHYQVYKTREDA